MVITGHLCRVGCVFRCSSASHPGSLVADRAQSDLQRRPALVRKNQYSVNGSSASSSCQLARCGRRAVSKPSARVASSELATRDWSTLAARMGRVRFFVCRMASCEARADSVGLEQGALRLCGRHRPRRSVHPRATAQSSVHSDPIRLEHWPAGVDGQQVRLRVCSSKRAAKGMATSALESRQARQSLHRSLLQRARASRKRPTVPKRFESSTACRKSAESRVRQLEGGATVLARRAQ